MKTLNTTKIIAAALLFTGLSAATTSAMADEYVSAQNKEAYAVAAGKYDDQALLPANAAPTILERHQANSPSGHTRSASPAATIPGPFADSDPHSGPAHGG